MALSKEERLKRNSERRRKLTPEQKTARHAKDYATKLSRPEWREEHLKRLKQYRAKNPSRYREYKASYRAKKLQATPKWADRAKIKEVYALAQRQKMLTGKRFQVDHIVPLKSPLVCGLHVHYNLQITGDFYNSSKNNRHWPEMP